jgi:hypothetical protein
MTKRWNLFASAIATALVVLAFVALPAFASAHEWAIGGSPLGAGNTAAVNTTTSSAYKLESKIGTTAVTIECAKQGSNGAKIIGGGTDEATALTFTTCKVVGQASCEVPNITTEPVSTALIGTTKLFDEFKPKAPGTVFTKIQIKVCALKGTYSVTGNAAGFDSAIGTSQKTHTLKFSSALAGEAGTALKFEGQPATLTGESTLELASGANWSAS